jgi:hypothetical protein
MSGKSSAMSLAMEHRPTYLWSSLNVVSSTSVKVSSFVERSKWIALQDEFEWQSPVQRPVISVDRFREFRERKFPTSLTDDGLTGVNSWPPSDLQFWLADDLKMKNMNYEIWNIYNSRTLKLYCFISSINLRNLCNWIFLIKLSRLKLRKKSLQLISIVLPN